MNKPRYEFETGTDKHYFEFLSIGNKGVIKKVVEFSKINDDDFYNLAFGDFDVNTGKINDLAVSNNGDSLKILNTIATILYVFTSENPKVKVFATGSTNVRTRLYRMGIAVNLEEIKKDFLVFGLKEDDTFEYFCVGEDYYGFLVTRKENFL
jgi:hypothetical protein